MNTTSTMPVQILAFKAMNRGALRGFIDIRLGASLIIRGSTLVISNGRAWIGLPGKPIIGADGSAAKDEKGKIRYAAVLEWTDRDATDRFNLSVLEALRISHPDALAEGGGE